MSVKKGKVMENGSERLFRGVVAVCFGSVRVQGKICTV